MPVTSLPTLGAVWGIGASNPGTALGPITLKDSPILATLPFALDWRALLYVQKTEPGLAAIPAIALANEQLAHEASLLAQDRQFFLTLGGDHSCAIGTWSGVAEAYADQGPIGLIWIDAHLDAHTPETSETGNVHGMPLAALLGQGDSRLTEILNANPKLLPENVYHIGARSFEAGEHQLLQRLGVRIYYMDEVREHGVEATLKEAMAQVKQNTVGYGISFCLDAINPQQAPAVGTPEPDGIDAQAMLTAFALCANDTDLLAFEIAEFNPNLDQDNKTEQLIKDTIAAITQ